MTHAALMNAALLFFLVFVTLLLVMFIGAEIMAPSAPPDSSAPAPGTPASPGLEPYALPVPEMPGPRRGPHHNLVKIAALVADVAATS
jgi:hypothetical protein